MGRSMLVAALGTGAAMLGTASARAAPTWLGATVISSNGCECGAPAAAADAAGDLTVAFNDELHGMEVVTHDAGGTWATQLSTTLDVNPVVAGNAAGDTLLEYQSGGDIEAIFDQPDEPWSSAVTSTAGTGGQETVPSVALDGRGDALIAWETLSGTAGYEIDTAYRPAGGTWQQPVTVGDSAVKDVAPAVAFDSEGHATIVWATEAGAAEAVASATMTSPGEWSAATQTTAETYTYVYEVQVALDAHGDATAAWTSYQAGVYALGVAQQPVGRDWTDEKDLVTGGLSDGPDPQALDLAVNATGSAAVSWAYGVNQPGAVAMAVKPAGGAWTTTSPLATVTGSEFMEYPQVAVSPDGTVTADWAVDNEGGNEPGGLWSVTESPGGQLGTATAISPSVNADFGGQTLVDPSGDVDIVASLFTGIAAPAFEVTEDAGGPVFNNRVVPTTGTVGVPVDFSVDSVDAWSPIVSTNWSFGDGTAATDEAVSHTYTAPGTYAVGTTSSDTLGNSTSQSSTIVINSATAFPGPSQPATPSPHMTAPLTLTHVTQSHRRWRESTHGRARIAALRRFPIGTRFGFTVNQAARVTFTFRGTHPRRRARGQISRRFSAAGHHTIRFTGRVGTRRLKPGRYTVTIHATAPSGAATRRLRFTVT
jgi:hypothetical protein